MSPMQVMSRRSDGSACTMEAEQSSKGCRLLRDRISTRPSKSERTVGTWCELSSCLIIGPVARRFGDGGCLYPPRALRLAGGGCASRREEMAGDTTIGAGLFQQRHLNPASLHRERAARVKTAAGRRIEQARHFTGYDRMTNKIRVGARHSVEQRPRIWMLGI